MAEDTERRARAAKRLEKDLLEEVPLLYGSPDGMEPHGDPGVVLARIHREELIRRNGGGVSKGAEERREPLPFERAMLVLAVVLMVAMFFAG